MIVLRSASQMRSSSPRMIRRVIESSAPNGSSRNSMSGFTASARATSSRCFMPPESSVRIGLLEPLEAHHLDVVGDALLALGARQLEQAESDVALDRQPRKNAALLEDKDAPRIRLPHRFAVDA